MIDIDELLDEYERDEALRHLSGILERIRETHRERLLAGDVRGDTSATRHAAECGHELAFGCCR